MLKESYNKMEVVLSSVAAGINQLNITTSNIQGKLDTRSTMSRVVGTGIVTVIAGIFIFILTKGV